MKPLHHFRAAHVGEKVRVGVGTASIAGEYRPARSGGGRVDRARPALEHGARRALFAHQLGTHLPLRDGLGRGCGQMNAN